MADTNAVEALLSTYQVVIAGTGHRPPKLGGYSNDAKSKLISVARMYLDSDPPDAVITGLALGWDQALAAAAIQVQIPLIGAVPFEGQEDKWPVASRVAYRHLLSQCKAVHIVTYGGYAGYKMQKRNEWMVDRCTKMLAMFDGVRDGGTWNCIEYANGVGREIVNLYDQWKRQGSDFLFK